MDWDVVGDVYLEIDEVPLSTPAWEVTNLAPLLDAADTRGGNSMVPGLAGVIPSPLRVTETRKLLPIEIRGSYDPEGDPYEDPFVGLETNVALLVEMLITPTSAATRTARLYLPSGSVMVGPVQIVAPLGLVPGGRYQLNGVLDLVLPEGRLVAEPGASN